MNEIIALSTRSISLKRNEYLNLRGGTDTNLYFVESGSLKVFVMLEEEEQIIRFGYKSNVIAILDSFLTEKPSNFQIQAIKKTELKVISKKELQLFLEKEGNLIGWKEMLESLILQQLEREVDLLTISPMERYRRVRARSPQLFQEIPDKHIANYLRMSPETLSRLKSLDFNQD